MQQLPEGWVADVLRFWFQETKPEQWFKKDEAFDRAIRERFTDVQRAVAAHPEQELTADPRTALAAVIVLDQFPRNLFRGTPAAFATDAKALAIAEAVLSKGFDATYSKDERLFLYLPFEHCEAADAQERCVALMATLDDAELTKWAQAHKTIIDRFGRFPHRNAILGRESTAEELEFLKQPGSSF
jgi:uncharacterized protein (DUF924 family)